MSAVAKVLVVDDDPAVQVMIRLARERAGHAVIVAGDGNKGLAECEHESDFELLDIFMPGMDGLQTMRTVREKRPLPRSS